MSLVNKILEIEKCQNTSRGRNLNQSLQNLERERDKYPFSVFNQLFCALLAGLIDLELSVDVLSNTTANPKAKNPPPATPPSFKSPSFSPLT